MAKAAGRVKNTARTSVWLAEGKAARAGSSRRSDQPAGLDRDRITEATVRLLDAEGLAKFSMRRLAAELNVTAMSVYWYVDTKDDLLELALDHVCGEMALPDPSSAADDWRTALRELAVAYRELLLRHPWVSPLVGNFLNIGPNWIRFAQRVQTVVRGIGLPLEKQAGAIAVVFQFVYGFGTIQGHFLSLSTSAGMTPDEYFRQAMGAISEQPVLKETLAASTDMMEARGGDTVEEMWERDFETGLELLMAGIDSMLDR